MSHLSRATDAIRLRDGRQLGFAELGDHTGRPLLHFHGAMGSPLRPSGVVRAVLAELGVRYVMVQRPGFGASDALPGRTMLDWSDDVAQLADALRLDRFSVLGVSAGGPYAAACAHRLPERVNCAGIVSGVTPLHAPGALTDAARLHRAGWVALRHAPRTGGLLLGTLTRGLRARPALLAAFAAGRNDELTDPEARAGFIETFLTATAPGVGAMVEDILLASGPWGFSPSDVPCEVHLWHGRNDPAVPLSQARGLAAALPRGRLAPADDEGHFFFQRRLAEILATLSASAARAT